MLKRQLLVVLISLSLAGCMSGVTMAGNSATGAVSNDSRSLQTMVDDQDISYQVNSRFASDHELSSRAHVSGAAFNHIVLLVGQTPTSELRAHAEQIAQSIYKVRRVYNQITVSDPLGTIAQGNDAVLTANVKARMLSTTDLKAAHFKVVSEDGTVYLLGLSTKEQANIAAEVARHSTGVKRVVKIVEYVS